MSRYQKGKTDLDFTEARRYSDWQWHQLTAPRSRQITTPAPRRSVFTGRDAFPAAKPTASKTGWLVMYLDIYLFYVYVCDGDGDGACR